LLEAEFERTSLATGIPLNNETLADLAETAERLGVKGEI